MRESLFFSEICEVEVTKKKESSIIISSQNTKYEVSFSNLFPSSKKIAGILDCIRKRNPFLNIIDKSNS
jgi:hypothetical protein